MDLRESLESYVQIRLLSDMANSYWQHSIGLIVPTFMFVDITYSMTLTIIGADSLPFHIYVFFPAALLCSVMFLLYLVPVLASVTTDSQTVLWEMTTSVPQLIDRDRTTLLYAKKMIRAQRVFGFKLSIFCFVSLGTAQDIITNSVSYALLIITLAKETKASG